MKSVTEKMRQLAKELLKKKEVDLIIGWEKGTFFYDSTPVFITRPEDTDCLIWDEFCAVNLAKYLMEYRQKEGKTAIFVKGCDARGVNRLLQDLQLDRDKIYLIGIPCPGMKSIQAAKEAGPEKIQDLPLEEKCLYCTHPNPVIYDVLLGEEVQPSPQKDRFAGVEEIEKMDPDSRYEFWSSHYDRCLRCYACRNVCPACNCRECIFDQGQDWLERSVDRGGNEFYGLVRAFHVAGRCTECGECERVCPAGIPIMLLNRKIAKDINELFGEYEAGLDLEVTPPLGLYKTEDPEEFM
ncbi:MAG: 4Fe-4S ferredoxin [Clostridia bacterium]|jgi:formate dehydrogenase subunit beta|nr:4Fe-4S ferredoxin [Clostridia bacterium]